MNKAAQHLEKLLLAHQTVEGETPLQYLVSVYQNPRNGTPLRVEAAKAAAVYVHKKQPVAVEVSGDVDMSYHPAPTYDVPLPADITRRLTASDN